MLIVEVICAVNVDAVGAHGSGQDVRGPCPTYAVITGEEEHPKKPVTKQMPLAVMGVVGGEDRGVCNDRAHPKTTYDGIVFIKVKVFVQKLLECKVKFFHNARKNAPCSAFKLFGCEIHFQHFFSLFNFTTANFESA